MKRFVRLPRFEQECRTLLSPSQSERILAALEWRLERSAESGQRVKRTTIQVCPLFPGDGYAYLAYYRCRGDEVTLISLAKRLTPVAPGPLDLED